MTTFWLPSLRLAILMTAWGVPSSRYTIYKLGVKANVLFFDARPARGQPWTDKLWVYDLRTNMHFTLKTRPLKRRDLDEFVACFQAPNGGSRWFESSAAHSDVPSYAGP
jgi:type I restriction enzyme M protein